MIRSIGLIGYGHFGEFLHRLARRYAPELSVRVYAPDHPADGESFRDLPAVAASDAVILAVPIGEYAAMLDRIEPHLGTHSVVVDVATVKKYTGELVRERASRAGHSFVAMHPMFGPESYEKRGEDVSGLRIVVTDHNLDDENYAALRARLRDVGFSIVERSADQHDRDLAETLFLTHYVGQVIARAGFERTEIDTVSFGYLMDAVDSVRHDTELFDDVCRFNPYCREVIDRFDRSEADVRRRHLERAVRGDGDGDGGS